MKNLDLERAIKNLGNQTKLSQLLDVHKSNISQWKKSGLVPMKHCIEIEKVTGISRKKLNPSVNWDYYAQN